MSAMEQVVENVAIADRCHVGCLTEAEKACIDDEGEASDAGLGR